MNQKKGKGEDVYYEKGEGKSATKEDRKEKCSICGKNHKTSAHGAKSKALDSMKKGK